MDYLKIINENPDLLSLLYDLDLMPEQCGIEPSNFGRSDSEACDFACVDKCRRVRMEGVVIGWVAAAKSFELRFKPKSFELRFKDVSEEHQRRFSRSETTPPKC